MKTNCWSQYTGIKTIRAKRFWTPKENMVKRTTLAQFRNRQLCLILHRLVHNDDDSCLFRYRIRHSALFILKSAIELDSSVHCNLHSYTSFPKHPLKIIPISTSQCSKWVLFLKVQNERMKKMLWNNSYKKEELCFRILYQARLGLILGCGGMMVMMMTMTTFQSVLGHLWMLAVPNKGFQGFLSPSKQL
jgi:hypothetical protein